jgi:hypothetical protein
VTFGPVEGGPDGRRGETEAESDGLTGGDRDGNGGTPTEARASMPWGACSPSVLYPGSTPPRYSSNRTVKATVVAPASLSERLASSMLSEGAGGCPPSQPAMRAKRYQAA